MNNMHQTMQEQCDKSIHKIKAFNDVGRTFLI